MVKILGSMFFLENSRFRIWPAYCTILSCNLANPTTYVPGTISLDLVGGWMGGTIGIINSWIMGHPICVGYTTLWIHGLLFFFLSFWLNNKNIFELIFMHQPKLIFFSNNLKDASHIKVKLFSKLRDKSQSHVSFLILCYNLLLYRLKMHGTINKSWNEMTHEFVIGVFPHIRLHTKKPTTKLSIWSMNQPRVLLHFSPWLMLWLVIIWGDHIRPNVLQVHEKCWHKRPTRLLIEQALHRPFMVFITNYIM